MSFTDKKILRKPELDAFIAQAFSPELMNAHYLQELQVHLCRSLNYFRLELLYNFRVVTLFGLLLKAALNHCMLCFHIFCIDRSFQS